MPPVSVYVGLTPVAERLKNLLLQQGIEAVTGPPVHGLSDSVVPGFGRSEVWIADEDDLPRVQAIVEDFDSGTTDPRSSVWHCPKCGERIEGQFTECWNCGTSRP